jgi:hypothetical protein
VVAGAHWTNATADRRAAIWLCDSEIGGRVLGAGTTIDGQGDRAVRADRIHVGGSVRLLDQFTSRGEIRLLGARIGGSVDLAGARLSATGGPAIDLEDATIERSSRSSSGRAGTRIRTSATASLCCGGLTSPPCSAGSCRRSSSCRWPGCPGAREVAAGPIVTGL